MSYGDDRLENLPDIDLLAWIRSLPPPAIAIEDGTTHASWGSVLHDAETLADTLRSRTGEGTLVAVALPRGYRHLVAFIACLMAGAVYAPLDPMQPAERKRHLLKRLAPDAVLGEGSDLAWAGAGPSGRDLDGPGYIIHTSGSSGLPKAVVMGPQQLAALYHALHSVPTHTSDRILWGAPIGFDASIFELLLAIIHGATLVTRQANEPFERAIRDGAATVATLVPSAMELFECVPESLNVVFSVGEPLRRSLAAEWLAHVELWNLYGPTEGTIWTTSYNVSQEGIGADRHYVPVGMPVGRNHVSVVDTSGLVCGPGERGEVVICGDHVATGYLDFDDEKPDESKFVNLELPGASSSRCYRTGDWAYHDHRRQLIIVGRTDDQVKVGGIRVELGEIDAVLLGIPGISKPVTVAVGHQHLLRLVAYYTSVQDGPDPAHVAAALADLLPAYMVPTHCVRLESFPLMTSGKVDKAALRQLASERLARGPAALDLDALITTAWESATGVPATSGDDNFFESGGHSLAAAQMITDLRKALGVQLPLALVFESADLATFRKAARSWLGDAEDGLESAARVPRDASNDGT